MDTMKAYTVDELDELVAEGYREEEERIQSLPDGELFDAATSWHNEWLRLHMLSRKCLLLVHEEEDYTKFYTTLNTMASTDNEQIGAWHYYQFVLSTMRQRDLMYSTLNP